MLDVLGPVLRDHQPVPSPADLQSERDPAVPGQATQRGAASPLLHRRQRLPQHAAGSVQSPCSLFISRLSVAYISLSAGYLVAILEDSRHNTLDVSHTCMYNSLTYIHHNASPDLVITLVSYSSYFAERKINVVSRAMLAVNIILCLNAFS